MSPKTRQAQLQLRADEVERAAKKKDLMNALKNWPRCILPLHNKLMSLEIPMDKLGEPDPDAVLSRQASHNVALSRKSSQSSIGGSSSEQAAPDGDVAERVIAVPQRARVLEDLSLSLIRDHVLAKLQPTVLSSRNLKGITSGELSTHAGLLRLLEFLTGVNPQRFDLTSELRRMSSVVSRLRLHMAARGDRAFAVSVSLEISWAEVGLIEIEKQTDESVSLRHRYTGQKVAVGLAVPLVQAVSVSNNWSEEKVCLTCGNYSQSIGALFSHSLVLAHESTPDGSGKRRKCVGMSETPPKPVGGAPKQLALADQIGAGTPASPMKPAQSEVGLTAGTPNSVISDADEPS